MPQRKIFIDETETLQKKEIVISIWARARKDPQLEKAPPSPAIRVPPEEPT